MVAGSTQLKMIQTLLNEIVFSFSEQIWNIYVICIYHSYFYRSRTTFEQRTLVAMHLKIHIYMHVSSCTKNRKISFCTSSKVRSRKECIGRHLHFAFHKPSHSLIRFLFYFYFYFTFKYVFYVTITFLVTHTKYAI